MKNLKYKAIGVFVFLVQFAIAQNNSLKKASVSISDALSDRKIERADKIENISTAIEGQVCVSICIDANGNVSRAVFRPQGSTTIDKELVTAAINNAKNYKFSASSLDKQCGLFTYRFTAQ